MTRSELVEKGIELFNHAVATTKDESTIYFGNEEMREMNQFGLNLFLAEQKRSDGCAFCTKHSEEHSFSIDGEFLVDHSDYGDNSSLRVYYCPLCGRDLTEGESV